MRNDWVGMVFGIGLGICSQGTPSLPSPDSENNDAWLQVAAIPNRDLVMLKFIEEQNLSFELHSDRHYSRNPIVTLCVQYLCVQRR